MFDVVKPTTEHPISILCDWDNAILNIRIPDWQAAYTACTTGSETEVTPNCEAIGTTRFNTVQFTTHSHYLGPIALT